MNKNPFVPHAKTPVSQNGWSIFDSLGRQRYCAKGTQAFSGRPAIATTIDKTSSPKKLIMNHNIRDLSCDFISSWVETFKSFIKITKNPEKDVRAL